MKILAADTSSFPASVAVYEDGLILGEYIVRNKKKHSQNLMPMTERMLSDLETDIADIDVFAVTVGPGSFTGLRIGISTIRAFAQATKKKALGISTLEALSYNFAGSEAVVVPMLDARRDEVFTAAYEFCGDKHREIVAPCVMTLDEVKARFEGQKVIFTGDGMLAHRAELTYGVLAPAQLSEVRAGAVAALAAEKINAGRAEHHNNIKPVYLRKSQAERLYKAKEN
ncbi:MAG: tRNA (adenosine(37)-N6)-threonylcarbamoyltransferase complex dimerization subunit type 1 TsaB [Clostridia bacterium]|nr:tRNA (adenosine(37)-N6)-threonylcarbamoyltransferase complex dimerization subunit type 1 TsaB [Clostridia bacterium]